MKYVGVGQGREPADLPIVAADGPVPVSYLHLPFASDDELMLSFQGDDNA